MNAFAQDLFEEIPEFSRPDHDEALIWPYIRSMDKESQEWVRFMYSELECMCGSRLEGMMLAEICAAIRSLGGNCADVRKFVKPQFAVGWCRLDFYICPYRLKPEIGFAIECDGERWHEKNRDNARDAWLRGQGILEIYRFPGAEIEKTWKSNAYNAIRDFLVRYRESYYGVPFA